MRYRLLGRTGLRVSELCLGAMTFGREDGPTAATAGRLLDRFADAGGDFLDTADRYALGESERILGELLGGERRDRFVLGTKYALQTHPGDVNAVGNHRKSLVQALEASLRRLRTDRIDVYRVEEVMRALDDQVRAGEVLYVGVSDRPAQVALAWLLSRTRTTIPILGASGEHQLAQNLACLDVRLEEAHLGRDDVKRLALGDRYDRIVEPEGRWTSV